MAPSVRMCFERESCFAARSTSARAERRAMSSQIGWPDGDERGVRQRQAERLADDLRRGRRAEELAAAAGAGAGPAAQLGRLSQRELAVREAGADRLDLAGVLAVERGEQVTPPGTRTHGRSCIAARAIIIAGRPLSQVATPSTPLRVGSERISRRKTMRRVVAIGQAVHHAGGALRAAVARIGADAGERDRARACAVPPPLPA